jgi:hypothetical protein
LSATTITRQLFVAVRKPLLAAASIAITLAVAEVGLRFVPALGPRSGTLEPRARPRVLTNRTMVSEPNYSGTLVGRDFRVPFKLNSLGFRDRELDLQELSARRPIVFVGDSFFQGWGVLPGERISERLAEKLQKRGIDAPVVNLGFAGFGTYQCIDVVKRFAGDLNPRLVVIGFFVVNDFVDNLDTEKLVIQGLSGEDKLRMDEGAGHFHIRGFLRGSRVVNLFKYNLWRLDFFRYFFNKLEVENDRVVLYEKNESPLQAKLFQATYRAMDELVSYVQAKHIPIVVVIIPDHLQVLQPSIFANLAFDQPQRKLMAYLAKLKVPTLDLLPIYRNAENPAANFFSEDKHWSPRGHNLAADALLAFLDREETLVRIMSK